MIRSIQRSFAKLFVRSIPKTTTVQEIEEIAQKFGEIAALEVPVRDDNLIRGFAYITYKNDADSQRAAENMQMMPFKGSNLQISIVKTEIKPQDNILNSRQSFKPRKSYDDSPMLHLRSFYT